MRHGRGNRVRGAVAGAALAWQVLGVTVYGGTPANSPDDICDPTADPCVVAAAFNVTSTNELDFGLRTVRVVPGGRFDGGVDLLCGAFEVAVGPKTTWMEVAGSARFTARRACSGDGATPCLTDATCATASLGTCSVGDGGIGIVGTVRGTRGPRVELRAAGNVAVSGQILATGAPGDFGGTVSIESSQGAVESNALIDVSGGGRSEEHYAGEPALGGSLLIRAARDVTVREQVLAKGGAGTVEVDAGGNLFLDARVLAQGVEGADVIGGTIDLSASGDLTIVEGPAAGKTMLNITGGTRRLRERYYSGSYGGPGGYGFLNAGNDLILGERVVLRGNSGFSAGRTIDDLPMAGDWYVEAQGDLTVDATITGKGRGPHGLGRIVSLRANGGVTLGRRARVTTQAVYAGNIEVYAGGPISLQGRLDAVARPRIYYGYSYGEGGYITVEGGDVTMSGRMQTGGGYGGGGNSFDVCRLRLQRHAKVNAGRGRQEGDPGYNSFVIGESMIAERGSAILGKRNSRTEITYRDPNKPPVLAGRVRPPGVLTVDPTLPGCPVCGNGEIDQGETCDDGNTVPGDGCSASCTIE